MDISDIKLRAIEKIEANKISTTEIGDVLGKTGQIEGVHALNPQMFKAGEVKVIYAINNSNYEVHKQLAESNDIKDKILFVYNVNMNSKNSALFVTLYKYRYLI